MSKFKVGDEVVIIGNSCSHDLNKGDFTTIVKIVIDRNYYKSCSLGHESNLYFKDCDAELKNKKSFMKKLTTYIKKALSPALQTQVKANYINGDLEPTGTGKDALIAILWDKYQTELTAMAQEIIDEEEKENNK